MPAPPARIRSARVPCGTSSSSTSPARYCSSKRLARADEARTAKLAIAFAICRSSHNSSSRSPKPMLVAITVRLRVPRLFSAKIRFVGELAETNPPTITRAPSLIPSRASSGVS